MIADQISVYLRPSAACSILNRATTKFNWLLLEPVNKTAVPSTDNPSFHFERFTRLECN
jgi:hypothetical protein